MEISHGMNTKGAPNGFDILSTLIQLLAEQEQVKIKFELEGAKQ